MFLDAHHNITHFHAAMGHRASALPQGFYFYSDRARMPVRGELRCNAQRDWLKLRRTEDVTRSHASMKYRPDALRQ